MATYPGSSREPAMKAQELILRGLSKESPFWQVISESYRDERGVRQTAPRSTL